MTTLNATSSSVVINRTLSDFSLRAMTPRTFFDADPYRPRALRPKHHPAGDSIAVNGQQSSVGVGRRHQLRRPGQPAFPAANPSPQYRLTTAHRSRSDASPPSTLAI